MPGPWKLICDRAKCSPCEVCLHPQFDGRRIESNAFDELATGGRASNDIRPNNQFGTSLHLFQRKFRVASQFEQLRLRIQRTIFHVQPRRV